MTSRVVDASVALKWAVEEQGAGAALAFRARYRLIAPDPLMAECSNILWKEVQPMELRKDGALMAARVLELSEIELVPSRSFCHRQLAWPSKRIILRTTVSASLWPWRTDFPL